MLFWSSVFIVASFCYLTFGKIVFTVFWLSRPGLWVNSTALLCQDIFPVVFGLLILLLSHSPSTSSRWLGSQFLALHTCQLILVVSVGSTFGAFVAFFYTLVACFCWPCISRDYPWYRSFILCSRWWHNAASALRD